ncbi:MAG: type II toxin-antitoxin system PemK/MazF family toxin [Elusimicrobiota bacterium]|nr:type II toxin-antitoxin system PemK/MazF family toxin [Elusimicrobiota bacterium]
MEKLIKGDIVVVPFPFSDLTQAKRRPALITVNLEGDDLILCQITSQKIKDKYAIPIDERNIEKGSLKKKNNVRPNRIFMADKNIILYRIGHLKTEKTQEIIKKIITIFKS